VHAGSGPAALRPLLLLKAVALGAAGLALFVGGLQRLGRQLTPFPKPVDDGALKQTGAYRFVRHPMYGGVLMLGLAWSLVSSPLALIPWAIAGPFLALKRRREEAWLCTQQPEYAEYARRVTRSFIPFVW
jgi:protein-S-isoprenylcysteine O-methyltransferase Ste14